MEKYVPIATVFAIVVLFFCILFSSRRKKIHKAEPPAIEPDQEEELYEYPPVPTPSPAAKIVTRATLNYLFLELDYIAAVNKLALARNKYRDRF